VKSRLEAPLLEIAQDTPGGAFVDHSPVHLITTATLDAIGVGRAEAQRYRPNIVIETSGRCPPFAENDWVGSEIHIGDVMLRATLPTPRCAVPTLQHLGSARSADTVRYLLPHNRVPVPEFGVLPSAGLYAQVAVGGTVCTDDEVRINAGSRPLS
jgi:uncharacterized protein